MGLLSEFGIELRIIRDVCLFQGSRRDAVVAGRGPRLRGAVLALLRQLNDVGQLQHTDPRRQLAGHRQWAKVSNQPLFERSNYG